MSGKTWVAIGSDNPELVKAVYALVSNHANNQNTVVKVFGEVEIDLDLTRPEQKLAADRLVLARAVLAPTPPPAATELAQVIVDSVEIARQAGMR